MASTFEALYGYVPSEPSGVPPQRTRKRTPGFESPLYPAAYEAAPFGAPGSYLTRPSVPGWYTGQEPQFVPGAVEKAPGVRYPGGGFTSFEYNPSEFPGVIEPQVPFAQRFWRGPAADPMAPTAPFAEAGAFTYQPPPGGEGQAYEATRRWLDPRLFTLGQATTRAGSAEEQMWQWQDFYRLMVGSSLGLEPGAYPTDPLARLQAQLQGQYDPTVAEDLYTQPPDFRRALQARGRGLQAQLQQRQAGLGAPEAYGGLIGQQQRAREALAQQAGAAWFPTAQAEQQKLQQQTDQLLQSIAQMELETTLAYTGAGL